MSLWACDETDKHGWFQIPIETGALTNPVNSEAVDGWVRDYVADLLAQPPKASANTTLQVRAWPNQSAVSTGPLVAAQSYAIVGKSATFPVWWRIRVSASVTGWIHGNNVQTAADVILHAGPGTARAAVATIPDGSTSEYVILGKDAATPEQWRIRFSNTVTDWVDAVQMQTHGEISHMPIMGMAPTAGHNLTVTATGPTALHTDWQAPMGIGDATPCGLQYQLQL